VDRDSLRELDEPLLELVEAPKVVLLGFTLEQVETGNDDEVLRSSVLHRGEEVLQIGEPTTNSLR